MNMDPTMQRLIERATDLVSGQHRQIAERIGVTPHALASWRRGKRRPTADNLARLGEELIRRSRELQTAGLEVVRAAQRGATVKAPAQEDLRQTELDLTAT